MVQLSSMFYSTELLSCWPQLLGCRQCELSVTTNSWADTPQRIYTFCSMVSAANLYAGTTFHITHAWDSSLHTPKAEHDAKPHSWNHDLSLCLKYGSTTSSSSYFSRFCPSIATFLIYFPSKIISFLSVFTVRFSLFYYFNASLSGIPYYVCIENVGMAKGQKDWSP